MINFSTWKRCFPVNKTRETRTFGESYVNNWPGIEGFVNINIGNGIFIPGFIHYPPDLPYYLPDSSWAIDSIKITGS